MFLLAWVCLIYTQVKCIIKPALCISRNRFEIALLIQSILMILAQVRILVLTCVIAHTKFLVGVTLHLHPLPTAI